ncbi:MAG TPA: cbb3-type cytochrome oxidase assembly protein CcoS [Pseudobdellovibrionaceae bacterium]|nr:cbb3-type cytochrome oxidase assembly protein CcoS [Pseudobdellovibrionaceae bacterium]
MNVLVIMIPMALLLGLGFVVSFIIATKMGQFDDTVTPAHRILEDNDEINTTERKGT